jgi:hypothetical protein
MALLEQLFNEGNILSRSVALQRMPDLTVVSKTPLQRPQIYDEVDDFYIHVLQDAEQPDGVRTLAASRIKTYLEKTDSYAAVEIAFANAITKELRRPFLNSTYMLSLLRTLEEIRVPRELEGQKIPIVYCSLTGLMSNRDIDIDIVVRCAAARVMGRMGWDERLQFDALALATAELVMETAVLFNASDNRNDPRWAGCGWSLYTAFHHKNAKEATGAQPFFPKGYLNRDPDSEVVQRAYKNSIPIMAELMFNPKHNPVDAVESLSTWLRANKSIDRKFDPACAPIPQMPEPAL